MPQYASPFPHFGQSTWVFGSVSVTSSRISMSAGRSSRRTTRAVRASPLVIPRSYPHFAHENFPSVGNKREPHFGQNMWEGVGAPATPKTFRRGCARTWRCAPAARFVRPRGWRRIALRAFGRRALALTAVRRLVLAERPLDEAPRRDLFVMGGQFLPFGQLRFGSGVPGGSGTLLGPGIRGVRINFVGFRPAGGGPPRLPGAPGRGPRGAGAGVPGGPPPPPGAGAPPRAD